jgi:hypothetical protein
MRISPVAFKGNVQIERQKRLAEKMPARKETTSTEGKNEHKPTAYNRPVKPMLLRVFFLTKVVTAHGFTGETLATINNYENSILHIIFHSNRLKWSGFISVHKKFQN